MPHVLVVGPHAGSPDEVQQLVNLPDAELTCPVSLHHLLEMVRSRRFDVAVVEMGQPNYWGYDAFDLLRVSQPDLPVIVLGEASTSNAAIDAMRRGAFDYVMRPVSKERLRSVVTRALEVTRLCRVTPSNVLQPTSSVGETGEPMVGQSPAMQEVYKAIGRVASQDVTVLILGESGTGKELVARAVHQYSSRKDRPFVAINCAAIPEALLESELFGYEKGAFTGADQRREGKFEFAHGGTVFLDEIADMSSATQAKVLRLIQEQQFERLGGTQSVRTDVRVIAATNKDLAQMVAKGTFRQDLYYRVNGFTIELPPLRNRPGDVALLTNHFVQRFNREMGRHIRAVAPEAIQWLQMNAWPGNVRELQSTIKYAMIKATGDVLTLQCFPPNPLSEIASGQEPHSAELAALEKLTRDLLHNEPGAVFRQLSALVDQVAVQEALAYAHGNQLQAAALLGISRTTLRAKLREMGLSVQKQVFAKRDAG